MIAHPDDPVFPTDFARSVVRQGKRVQRRRRVMAVGAVTAVVLLASLGLWRFQRVEVNDDYVSESIPRSLFAGDEPSESHDPVSLVEQPDVLR